MNEENINYVTSSDAAEAEVMRAYPSMFTFNELFMFHGHTDHQCSVNYYVLEYFRCGKIII